MYPRLFSNGWFAPSLAIIFVFLLPLCAALLGLWQGACGCDKRAQLQKTGAAERDNHNVPLQALQVQRGWGHGAGTNARRQGEGSLIRCGALWTPRCHIPCHATVL